MKKLSKRDELGTEIWAIIHMAIAKYRPLIIDEATQEIKNAIKEYEKKKK